jgi:hypothetical protein
MSSVEERRDDEERRGGEEVSRVVRASFLAAS